MLNASDLSGVASVATIADILWDDSRDRLFYTTTDGSLRSWNPNTGLIVDNVFIGGTLAGLSFTPDRTELYIAQRDAFDLGTTQFRNTIHNLNIASGSVTDINFIVSEPERGVFNIAVANNGIGLFTPDLSASGRNPFRQIETSNNSISVRSDFPGNPRNEINQLSSLVDSEDGRYIFILEGNTTLAPLHIYDSQSNSFVVRTDSIELGNEGFISGTGSNPGMADISSAANLVVNLTYSALFVLDNQLDGVVDLSAYSSSGKGVVVVFSHDGSKLYFLDPDINSLVVFDTSDWSVIGGYEIQSILQFLFNTNTLFTDDSDRIVVIETSTGFEVVDLNFAAPPTGTATASDDKLFGMAAGDIIDGLDGNDLIAGLEGDDTILGGAGNDLLHGAAGSDSIVGGSEDDWITAGTGDDFVDGGPGADTLDGGAGVDTLSFASAVGPITALLTAGTSSGATVDVFKNFEIVQGSSFDDSIAGVDGLDDSLHGGSGNDTLTGMGGFDSLSGDDGNDSLNGGTFPDTLSGGDGDDTLLGGSGNDLLRPGNGDDSADGGGGNDSIRGGAGLDTILGGDGNDTVHGLGDADSIVGDAGIDILHGGTGIDTMRGGTELDVLFGDGGNDVLRGESGNDYIEGNDGNDSIVGGTFNDTLKGGIGNDTVEGNAGNDILEGNDGDDSLIGGTGADTLVGFKGFDTLLGRSGSDILVGMGQHDSIDGAGGNDLVFLGYGTDTALGGNGNDTINGLNGTDHISGDAGNDVLNGEQGNDTLIGGADDDVLNGGTENDLYIWNAGDGRDSIFDPSGTDTLRITSTSLEGLSQTFGPSSGIETIDHDSGAAFNIVGSAGNDNWTFTGLDLTTVGVIRGGAGNDTLDGTTSGDNLQGNTGADLLVGRQGDDTIIGGAGSDLLIGMGQHDSIEGGGGNDLIFMGFGTDTAIGGTGADTINGLNGTDDLSGNAGADVLNGEQGADTLTGGGGNDTLTGGTQSDLFRFDPDDGSDNITDFENGIDLMEISGSLAISDLTIAQVGANTTIDFGAAGTTVITLNNTQASDIDGADFIFV